MNNPLLNPALPLTAIVMGGLAALSFVGGFAALIWNSMMPTQFTPWNLSVGSAGVAFIGIGVLIYYNTFRRN